MPNTHRDASIRSLLSLLLAAALCYSGLVVPTRAEYVSAAQSNRAHCRIFLHATDAQTRFLLLESYVEQDGVEIYDGFPVVEGALTETPLEDVYKKLRPSFLKIQEFLLSREKPLAIEPRHCHTHLVTSGAAMRALEKAQSDVVYARIHQETIEDAQFPFLLAREDLRTIPADLQSYFHIVGANYLDGKITASLGPGTMELFGLLNLHEDATEMVFDSQERWRRSKRQKHTSIPLNTSDFFIREYTGYGRKQLRDAITVQLREKQSSKGKLLEHPCMFSGYNEHTELVRTDGGSQVELSGRGDAADCMSEIQSYVDKGNKECPEGNFCALNGRAQPRPPGIFYGVGLFRAVVHFTDKFLQTKQAQDRSVQALQLPTPTLAALRSAADALCATPFSYVQDSRLVYGRNNSSDLSSSRNGDACFDLCYAVVLLKQFGIQEDEERVHFASQFDRSATNAKKTAQDESTWLTGAFLYLEAIQQRRNYAMEAELLAVQVTEGVPIGFNLSLLLFLAALVFLYLSTGASRVRSSASSRGTYQRVINGAGKVKQQENSTQAILFIDDASE